MDILRALQRVFLSRESSSSASVPNNNATSLFISGEASPFPYIGQSQAMQVATVCRCVKVISDGVASLPLRSMTMQGGRYVEDTKSPLHYLLSVQPQPEMSAFDFWSLAVTLMLLEGNAYIFPRYVLGELTDLVLCHKGAVSHDVLNSKYVISDSYNGVFGTFDESEVIHLYLHSCDGRRGESVITHACRTLGIAVAGDEETRNRFANGGTVRGFVTNDKSVTGFGRVQDEELSNAASSIRDQVANGTTIFSVPGDCDFKQYSLSSTDMQFLETRKFTVREICRFFGVPTSYVFDDNATNYKSAEMANLTFLTMTLDPILKRIENELRRKLVSRSQCCKKTFMYDRSDIYSLDLQSKAAYYKQMLEIGAVTANEIRRKENLPEVDGGDTPLVSANLLPLDTIREAKGATGVKSDKTGSV